MTWPVRVSYDLEKKLAKAKKIKIRLIVDKFIATEQFEEEYLSTHKQYELAALITACDVKVDDIDRRTECWKSDDW